MYGKRNRNYDAHKVSVKKCGKSTLVRDMSHHPCKPLSKQVNKRLSPMRERGPREMSPKQNPTYLYPLRTMHVGVANIGFTR